MPGSPNAPVVVEEFLTRQRKMYLGGDADAVRELLPDDVRWHVPGTSPIAGDYEGREAVVEYFRQRRTLAGGTMQIEKGPAAHHDEALVGLADGRARIGDEEVVWRTAGVYRVRDGKIAEAWLVPLDQARFERIWAATRTAPFVYSQRVRPQDCAANATLGHPRFFEFFEAAFIDCWRERFGRLAETLGTERRLTVAGVNARYLAPVRVDDELRIEVSLDRISERAIKVHYEGFVGAAPVVTADAHYVCVKADSGVPTPLPQTIARE